MSSVCTGSATPSTRDGCTSVAASLPNRATSSPRTQRMTEAWMPAELPESRHGPTSARRAQRPVRRKTASPGCMVTPACSSHASMSSV